MSYQPSATILSRYAKILIHFALADGRGVQSGEVVLLQIPESARDFAPYLQEQVLLAGGHPIVRILPEGLTKSFIELANSHQLQRWPQEIMLAEVAQIDHRVRILAQADKHEMDGVDSGKLMQRMSQTKFYLDAMHHKEQHDNMHRTLGLYGTQAMADEVGMSLKEYRDQIIDACFLDHDDPVDQRNHVFSQIRLFKDQLNNLDITKLHITGPDADLWVQIGPHRKRLGGSGKNIPSFEIFISPDRRGTQGRIRFNQPLYRYGTLISNIKLQFVDGIVVDCIAEQGQQALQDMIAVANANKIGEYSLTDRRLSRISRFMGETLYDENVGGQYGNTHLALGNAYKESFPGSISQINTQQREEMGYNDSVIHTDIVSTTNRTVTAFLIDGSHKIIYQDGEFMMDRL